MPRKYPSLTRIGLHLVLSGALLALLAGCASMPPPTGLMDQATESVNQARQAGAADFAPLELGFAVKKLDLAQSAMGQEQYALAAQLAAESESNSALARVKSELADLREKIRQQSAQNEKARKKLDASGPGPGSDTSGGAA